MTPVMTSKDFSALGAPDLVYIRTIRAGEILADIDDDIDVELDPNQTLYALHGADGERLAVMLDRETAVAAAEAHDMAPVSVH